MSDYLSREPVLSEAGFIGRQAELDWVNDILSRPSPQNCNITGEPRSGKTSLLHQIKVRQIGILSKQVGLHVWLRLAELPEHRAFTFWKQFFLQLRVTQQEAGLGQPGEKLPEDERLLFDALDEYIDLLLTETECQRLLILIDDFDLLIRGISSRDLDWLRSLATRYSEALAFVITSSDSLVTLSDRLLQREELQMQVSPFANMFHNRELTLLTRVEAEELCRETAVAEEQPALSEEDINFLLQEAGRHPALLKIGLSYLFEARQYEEGPAVYQEVAGDIRLDQHVNWLCRQLWLRRTTEEQLALTDISYGESVEIDPILRARLKKQLGLVEKRQGELTLFADCFCYWIQRELQKDKEPASRPKSASHSDELTYLPEQRLVYLEDREVTLTSLEGRLLEYFLAHKNEVCTIADLLENVWGPGKTRSVVEKAVNRLRVKIEEDPKRPRFILSARGEGYIFRLE